MANYEEAKVTLTNTPLNKLKSTAKNKHVTYLYIFILLFLDFSKESFIWNKKILPTCLIPEITGKNKISTIIIQNLTV